MSSLWAWTAAGNWLLCKDVGAEHLCSHCFQDQLWEGGWQEVAGNCKFLESLENKKVVFFFLGGDSPCLLLETWISRSLCNARLDKNEGLDENQIGGLEGIRE